MSRSKTVPLYDSKPTSSPLINIALLLALCFAILNQYVSQLAMMIVIAACAYQLLRSGLKANNDHSIPWIWILAFSLVALAAVPMSIASGSGRPLDSPLRYTILIVPLLALARYQLPARYILRCCSVASIASCVFVLTFDLYPDTRFKFNDVTRYDFGLGLLDSAYAAVFFLPFVCAQIYVDQRRPLCMLLGACAVIASLVIMVMSGTRASWLALVVAPVISAVALAPRSRRLILIVILVVSAAIAGSYLYSPMVKERTDAGVMNLHQYFTAEEIGLRNSLGLRLDLWKAAVEIFKRYPAAGPSYQQRSAVIQELIDTGVVSKHIGTDGKGSSHNEILNALSQRGLLGFLALILLYLVPASTFFKFYRSHHDRVPRAIAASGFGGVVVIIICGLAEAPLMSARFATLYGFVLVVMFSVLRQWRSDVAS